MLEYFLDKLLSVGPVVASGQKVLYSDPFSDAAYSFRAMLNEVKLNRHFVFFCLLLVMVFVPIEFVTLLEVIFYIIYLIHQLK